MNEPVGESIVSHRGPLQRLTDGDSTPSSDQEGLPLREHSWPALALTGFLVACFAVQVAVGVAWPTAPGQERDLLGLIRAADSLGLSAEALRNGRLYTLFSSLFVHGGLAHIALNCMACLGLTHVVASRLGTSASAITALFGAYLICGVVGGATFVAMHPSGTTPVVGASGAICGLWGLAARFDALGGLNPLLGRAMRQQLVSFILSNAILVVPLQLLGWLTGRGILIIAWEAHLGGFVSGALLASLVLKWSGPPANPDAAATAA